MNRAMIAVLLAAFVISGCASYEKQYRAYMNKCSLPENQKIIKVPQQNGQELVINQGCVLSPPTDASAKWVNLGGTLGTALLQETGSTIRSVQSSKDNRKLLSTFGENMGHTVGGDATIGDANSGNQTLDQTAEPVIVEPFVPEPEPASDD